MVGVILNSKCRLVQSIVVVVSFLILTGGIKEAVSKELSVKSDDQQIVSTKNLVNSYSGKEDENIQEIKDRVKKQGVLGIISKGVTDKNSVLVDIFTEEEFISDVEEVLNNVGILKSYSVTKTIKRESAVIENMNKDDFNNNAAVDKLLSSLINRDLKAPKLNTRRPLRFKGTFRLNERSRSTILSSITQNINGIKHAYGKRMKEKEGLKGKITVKFAIDESGKVVFCSVVKSTVNDSVLEENIIQNIRQWGFDRVNRAGDMTEVVYTFVFS